MTRTLKMMGMLILLLTGCCFQNQLFAQGRQITGTVTSSDNNQPIQGVTVTVKGTKNAVVTDAQGRYKITVDSKATTLVFSNASYSSYEAPIGNGLVNVELKTDVRGLDEVVIGYQTIKRKDVLASVSSVGAKELKDIPINSAAEALNGRLAGVTATTSEGSPDAKITIRIRGGISITGDNSPLYIIDGVQVENGLTLISPQDIQSIDVLKDAAATAIYGARGANGVIVVTTKSGHPGRTTVSYNGYIGVKELARELDVMSPYQFVLYQSERSRGSSTDSTTFTNNFGHTFDSLDRYRYVAPVDWQHQAFGRSAFTETHNISIAGGNKKIVYNFGYTYTGDQAIILNSSFKRNLLNFKADYNVTKNLKVGVLGKGILQDVYGAGVSDDKGSSYNRLRNAIKYRPFLSAGETVEDPDPLADPNVGNGLNLVNPIDLANSEYRKKTTEEYNATAYINYTFLKNFTFRSTINYDWNKFIDRQFSDTLTPYSIITGAKKPIAGLDTSTKKTLTNSNVLTYAIRDWRHAHDFSILVGEETYDLRTTSTSDLFKSYPSFTKYSTAFSQTSLGQTFAGYPKLGKTRYTNLSFFGRINYAYKDKYLFSADVRADGASKFAPGLEWGYFPSASIAWRVKREKFMENINFINDFKIRAGYGTVGNNRIGDYLYLTTFRNDGTYYYGLNGNPVYAYYPSSLVNPVLQWESKVDRNLGFDMTVFKNRIDLSVDIYRSNSSHLLLNVPIASTYGYSTQFQNVGKTVNKGIEFQLNAAIIRHPNGFNWNANFNISFNKNKILALGQNQTSFYPAASWGVSGQPTDYIEKVGSPVGSMYGLVADGFYKVSDFDYNTTTGIYTLKTGVPTDAGIIGTAQPGAIKFKDLNGDGVIDLDHDRQIIGNPNPKFTGGLNQQFSYKHWDMSFFVNFSYGNTIYNANKIELTNGYSNNSNMLKIMEGRWKIITPSGQTAQYVTSTGAVWGIAPDQLSALNANATIWQPIKSAGAFYPSSWAMEDGSFLRFNNITIGYTFTGEKLRGTFMSKLRMYATVNNLAIITNYTGYDPEVSVRSNNSSTLTPGLDYSAYPKSRSFIFGVNATF